MITSSPPVPGQGLAGLARSRSRSVRFPGGHLDARQRRCQVGLALVLKAPDALSQEIRRWRTSGHGVTVDRLLTGRDTELAGRAAELVPGRVDRTANHDGAGVGVQKITGLSGALNVLTRLFGAPPSASAAFGKPRSPVGPPADSYWTGWPRSRRGRRWPVSRRSCRRRSPARRRCRRPWSGAPCRAPSGPEIPPAARQAWLMAAVASVGNVDAGQVARQIRRHRTERSQVLSWDSSPPLNFWLMTLPL